MADDPKLKIQIETTADLKGAEEAVRAVEKIGETAEKAAPKVEEVAESAKKVTPAIEDVKRSAEQAAPKFEDLAEAGQKTSGTFGEIRKAGGPATQILRGLEQAGRGGIGALFGLAQAIRGVIAAVTAGLGPIGLLIAAAGLLGGAFLALKDKFRPAKESIDDIAKKTEAARLELVKLNQEKVDQVVANYKRIEDAADSARQAAAAVRAQKEARFDANEEIEVAKLRERTDLTRSQRLQEEQAIRARGQAARDKLQEEADVEAISGATTAFKKASKTEEKTQQSQQSAAGNVAELNRIEARKKQIDQAQAELESARSSFREGAILRPQGRITRDELDRRRSVLQGAERQAADAGQLSDEEQAILENADSIRKTLENLDAELQKAADAASAAGRQLDAANFQAETNRTRREQRARAASEVGAIDARILAREAAPDAVSAAKQASDRGTLEQSLADKFSQDTSAAQRSGTSRVLEIEKQIRETPPSDLAAVAALKAEREKLIAAQEADLENIRKRYEEALAAIRATPVEAPRSNLVPGLLLPGVDNGLGESFPTSRSISSHPESLKPIGGPIPTAGQEIDVDPLQDSVDEGADALKKVTVPPIDPQPVVQAVNLVNTRLEKEVKTFANAVVAVIGDIRVRLDEQRRSIEALRQALRNKA